MLLLGQKVLRYLIHIVRKYRQEGIMDRIGTKKRKNRRTAASIVLSREDTAGISAKEDVGVELQV